ncbi:monosaccharide ABC transporter substrate-binding protein, CUT2 family (TC 3.A.1.2.-) [Gracilibacillus ureilyticus]|uniref:Monosaccharide ABC transporter substrate-binding protein, CUT2 family (TC 3.A.1.2.-) n=1 Tax=Gracilibacillus ureilyticus TaxID=531814 RepID=A0A1H9NDH2_9BACI|nr:sugar-binding protein [Gracilibacillus ureilyticus]SER33817.1 monosaccharide ABC transporter substrate-binding protein, CUT2 family (TC 3.A.1.2.-) [Gracilibacillus ureilyticus]
MNRKTIIYIILSVCLFISISFSIYYYTQAEHYDQQIDEVTEPDSSLPAYHFVLIGEEMDHDYWRLVGEGAKDTEEKYDVFVEYEGPRRSNPEEQLELLDIAIKSDVDGIIVQALSDDFLPLINKAVREGIPVITIDTDAPESTRASYIGTDNYEAGKLAGETLVKDTNGEATIGIITGSFTNAHHQLRVQGFREIISREEGIEVVAIEESNITRVTAEEKAYQMLKEYPNIDALYGTSALDGIGMAQATASLNLTNDDLYLIAFDTLPENVELMKQGKIDVLIEQKPYEMGYRSIELMLDVMEGLPVEDAYNTDVNVVRIEDIIKKSEGL